MPSEIVPTHVEIHLPPTDFYMVYDYAVTSPIAGVGALLPREFWDGATVTWVGGDFTQMQLQYQSNVGWSNLLIWLASENGQAMGVSHGDALDTLDDNWTSQANLDNPSTIGGLRWIFPEGATPPSEIIIEGDFLYDHTYGRDPESTPTSAYLMRLPALDDLSIWTAPAQINQAADNEEFVATVAVAGFDNDAGAHYHTIAVYNRELVTGRITGKYLGSDRRFMGS